MYIPRSSTHSDFFSWSNEALASSCATRVAKLLPWVPVRVEVIDNLPIPVKTLP
jgi:hypothetical protein